MGPRAAASVASSGKCIVRRGSKTGRAVPSGKTPGAAGACQCTACGTPGRSHHTAASKPHRAGQHTPGKPHHRRQRAGGGKGAGAGGDGGSRRGRRRGTAGADPITIRHTRQCWDQAARMVPPVAAIAQQHSGRTAALVARLARHIGQIASRTTQCSSSSRHRRPPPPHLRSQVLLDGTIHSLSTVAPEGFPQQCRELPLGWESLRSAALTAGRPTTRSTAAHIAARSVSKAKHASRA
jgi:hypothetical protein